ncbi:hypothetical protein M3E18_03270 [Kocuria sp. p3-SID1433]|uniref:hypothetical protein n=1 Tax=unclassified Kocuria TaxID=2649579 RepID=UPI0021A4C2C0|nr:MULTISPECIES: hypothetical protein [unclassified Kocuria]MCT1601884.1 hypothetical protein [Kocuria sp. p3-SID1428]MCT2179567.1 hypothetical protein [Kocuria sp. p3-SID1433]
MSTPAWRVRFAPARGTENPTQIRVKLGNRFRDFSPADARAIADRLHDLADRIENDARTDA